MLQSYVTYIGVLFASWLLAFLADRYNNKKLIWVIIVLLTAIAGLRHTSVGIDTYSYYTNFKILALGHMDQVYGFENTFKYFCYFLMNIYNNPTFIFTVLALITNGCMVLRLWDFRNISSFSCMVACYYMGFFFMSLNVTRQFVSIAIVFYATKYLVKKQYISYMIGVIIAVIFHQSACIGVVLFVVELLNWKSLLKKQKRIFSTILLCSPAIIYFVLQSISKYEKYLRNSSVDVGLMVFVKLLLFIASIVFLFVLKGNANHLYTEKTNTIIDKSSILLICVSYFTGLCFCLMSYFLPALNRIGWYFLIYESVYFGMLIKSKTPLNKMIFVYVITILMGYAFIHSMTNNSQGTMPYLFFWQ